MNDENEEAKKLFATKEWQEIEKECSIIKSILSRMDKDYINLALIRIMISIATTSGDYFAALGVLEHSLLEIHSIYLDDLYDGAFPQEEEEDED